MKRQGDRIMSEKGLGKKERAERIQIWVKRQMVCVRKEEVIEPDSGEKVYVGYFEHKNSSHNSRITFAKEIWKVLKVGEEYKHEVKKNC